MPSELAENAMVGLRVRDRPHCPGIGVAFIVRGYNNKEIAVQLGTSEPVNLGVSCGKWES